MKKLLKIAAMALAMAAVLTGCASGGSAKASEGSGIPHPRSYVFDVIDGGSANLNLTFNSYGPNYQVVAYFTGLVKKDKPQAGDTVTFKMKAVSDVDLPLLLVYPCSTSPNWTGLDDGNEDARVFAKDVKAGEPFECDVSFVLATKMGADFALCIQYDNEDQEVKTGGPCELALERVCESTDTAAEVGYVAPTGPQTTEVVLQKYSALLNIETNHPWVNGAQDMSVISNYQATPEVTNAFAELPKAGDTMHLKWKAVSDVDIEKVFVRAVDCSAAAGWWKELNSFEGEEQFGYTLVENVVAGEPFEVEVDIPFTADVVAQVNLCIWYDIGMANPDGPAMCKLVRD